MTASELVDKLIDTGEWLDVIIDGEKSTVGYDGSYIVHVIVQIKFSPLLKKDIHNTMPIKIFKLMCGRKNIEVIEKEV